MFTVKMRQTEGGLVNVRHGVDEFNEFRQTMNDRILGEDNLLIKRFFNLDTNAYKDGALTGRTKEMMGLVASLVLRCDDCIRYHIQECPGQTTERSPVRDRRSQLC